MNAKPEPIDEPRARILECTAEEYFADPCETPSLSQSIARTLVTRSPLHAWTEHPKLGGIRREPTDATKDGDVIHALVLDEGHEQIVVVRGFDDFRTKAAREARDEAIAAGRTPVLEHKYESLESAARVLRQNIRAFGIDLCGQSEVAIEWVEDGNLGDVLCRGKMDHMVLSPEAGAIYDVKKIRSADRRTCERSAAEYGYDIQHAAYISAVERLRPDLAGRVDYVMLFMELEPPYAVVPARPSGTLRELGDRRWARAVATWEDCLARNYWPSYTKAPIELDAPAWALMQEEAAEEFA